jgi:hypothetical protein
MLTCIGSAAVDAVDLSKTANAMNKHPDEGLPIYILNDMGVSVRARSMREWLDWTEETH